MKLNRLPVLIRTEVTAAAKGAPFPAAYSKALNVLQEAVDELSFAKLRQVNNMADTLASYAKASQDGQAVKKAKLLKYGYRRAALWLAQHLAAQRKKEFIGRGETSYQKPGTTARLQLQAAGFLPGEVGIIGDLEKLPDSPDMPFKNTRDIREAARGVGRKAPSQSDVYRNSFGTLAGYAHAMPFNKPSVEWCRENSARGLARRLNIESEIVEAKWRVELVRAWCDEFLKNLPKTVSKAKVSK